MDHIFVRKFFKTKIHVDHCMIKGFDSLHALLANLKSGPFTLVSGDTRVEDNRANSLQYQFSPSSPFVIEFGLEFVSVTSTVNVFSAGVLNDRRLTFELTNGRRMVLGWRDDEIRIHRNALGDPLLLVGYEERIDLIAKLGYIGYSIPEDDSGFGAEGYNGA